MARSPRLPALLALGLSSALAPAAARADAPAWAPTVGSPAPFASFAPTPADGAFYARCGAPDAALAREAGRLLDRRLEGRPGPSPEELSMELAALGVPQPRVRAWSQAAGDEPALLAGLGKWLGRPRALGRCGVARGADGGGRLVAAVVVLEALADLAPLPSRVRSGQWLSLEAELHAPAYGVSVVLLGPTGAPRRVLSSLSEGRVLSRFALDAPGAWLVQVVADLDAGPLPVLEARVFVEVEPSAALLEARAAGEEALADGEEATLAAMLDGARTEEGLRPLARDGALDRLARAHAAAMLAAGRVGHDLGAGPPADRVAEAGLDRAFVGENVASAPSVLRAHRALWASPSHRENLLLPTYRRVGVGVVTGADGRRFVCELFSE
ncbi:MAG: CAP domain-containing protein [Myxococcales bacterium]|nr:CAP domain-containing protein [Myxococcales bacterium]